MSWTKKEDAFLISLDKQNIPIEMMKSVFKGKTKIEIHSRLKYLKNKEENN
ncbi:MAG: hypothetical protein RSF40_01965 [Oscillospiraceae bacterium]